MKNNVKPGTGIFWQVLQFVFEFIGNSLRGTKSGMTNPVDNLPLPSHFSSIEDPQHKRRLQLWEDGEFTFTQHGDSEEHPMTVTWTPNSIESATQWGILDDVSAQSISIPDWLSKDLYQTLVMGTTVAEGAGFVMFCLANFTVDQLDGTEEGEEEGNVEEEEEEGDEEEEEKEANWRHL